MKLIFDPETGLLLPRKERVWTPHRERSTEVCTVGPNLFSKQQAEIKFLLHFEGADNSTDIIDSSLYSWNLVGNANVKISTAQMKFGSSSLHVTKHNPAPVTIASTSRLSATSTTPYGFDFWQYHVVTQNFTAAPNIFSMVGSSSNVVGLAQYSTTMRQQINFGGGPIGPQATAASSNAWHHVYLGFDGTNFGLCIDGTQVLTGSGFCWNGLGALRLFGNVGDTTGADDTTDVYFDEMRLIVGSVPYPIAGGFAPPITPY